MTAKVFVLAAIFLFALGSGIQAKNHHDEEPQVMMYTDCQTALATFRNIFDRYYFAVSADGKVCTDSYCQSGGCQKHMAARLTLLRCKKESGMACLRYGPDDRVPELEGN